MPRAILLLVLLAARAGAAEPEPAGPADLGAGPGLTATRAHDAMTELAKPFSETRVKRLENVFFISLPFTALYSSLFTLAAGFAIEGKRFKLDAPYLTFSMSLATAGAAFIAGRDAKGKNVLDVPLATPPAPGPASVQAAPMSATGTEPSSTVLR
jgi:hypothetical protein